MYFYLTDTNIVHYYRIIQYCSYWRKFCALNQFQFQFHVIIKLKVNQILTIIFTRCNISINRTLQINLRESNIALSLEILQTQLSLQNLKSTKVLHYSQWSPSEKARFYTGITVFGFEQLEKVQILVMTKTMVQIKRYATYIQTLFRQMFQETTSMDEFRIYPEDFVQAVGEFLGVRRIL
ncbi:SANT/Myb_domain [Hexamita inflata]|uniref:SANT/Myb domain n=1 Tax=Hexamita inflata TaxID=28002 RepID=A0AA86RFB7_9EUKA|nr:SANT/Myb domain [Hexamita inflata]